nr:hypothetical protein [Tanacetum cinerariifolium]
MASGQISLGLSLPYASSTITTQKPTEGKLDLLFEAMYDDYVGGQPSATLRNALATSIPSTLQNVDELKTQRLQGQPPPATTTDNVLNAMFDDNTYVKGYQEKDKIGSKPGKNRKRGEAGRRDGENLDKIKEKGDECIRGVFYLVESLQSV